MLATAENIQEDYLTVQNMVFHLANRFSTAYGGEFDDWVSEANLSFVKAYRKFDERGGTKLSSWVYNYIRTDLLSHLEKRIKQSNRYESNYQQQYQLACTSENRVKQLLEALSEDGVFVAQLALNPNEAVWAVTLVRGGTAGNLRRAIKDYLKDIGWTSKRIIESFDEIKQCLKENA